MRKTNNTKILTKHHKNLKIGNHFLFMKAGFSFEDAKEIEEQTMNIVNNAAKEYGWRTVEEREQNIVLNSFDSGKSFKSTSRISEIDLRRNKTRLGNEMLRMIFDYTEEQTENSDIFIMFRPKIGNAYISFNSSGFCEDSLSAYFSESSVLLNEFFCKNYIKGMLFRGNDADFVFSYYNHIFDRISKALYDLELKENENEDRLTGFGVPRNFPTFEEYRAKTVGREKKNDFYVLLQTAER